MSRPAAPKANSGARQREGFPMSDPSIQPHLDLSTAADRDPQESAEWRDALAVGAAQRRARSACAQMMDMLAAMARDPSVGWQPRARHALRQHHRREQQPPFPGDLAIEERLASLMRWNALAMVVRANQAYGELGGHIASYASAADLFEVGFNHFFRAPDATSAATWCSSSRIRRRACTRAPSSRAA